MRWEGRVEEGKGGLGGKEDGEGEGRVEEVALGLVWVQARRWVRRRRL